MTSAQPFNFDGFFDPPAQQEVTAAERWHEAGEHEDLRRWAKQGCIECQDDVDALTIHVQLNFTRTDLQNALMWEKENGFNYTKNGETRDLLIQWALERKVEYEDVI